MSFADIETGIKRSKSNTKYSSKKNNSSTNSDAGDFDSIGYTVSDNIGKLQRCLSQITRLEKNLGTSSDTVEMREKMHQQISDGNSLAHGVTADLRRLKNSLTRILDPKLKKNRFVRYEKLMNDFKVRMRGFEATVKSALNKEENSVAIAKRSRKSSFEKLNELNSSLVESGTLTTPLMMMEFADIENDLTINEMIIEKREEEILDLQSKVVDVNDIFRDLATIVSNQHEGLESIESSVADSESRAAKGVEELLKATKHQRKSRGKIGCMLLILLLTAGGLIFYLYVLHPKFNI